MSWLEKEKEYVAAGFSESQIKEYRDSKKQEYLGNGVDQKAVDDYFGVVAPDEKNLQEVFKNNLSSYKPQEADTILEAMDAGWQMSTTDLMRKAYKGQNINPDTVVPEHAATYLKVAEGLAQITGDVPAMITGYIAGKAGGSAIGGAVTANPLGALVGGEIGAQFASNAAPEAIRTALIESYNRGEFEKSSDFIDFASTVFMKSLKSGAVGVATFGAGKGVEKVAGPILSSATTTAAKTATEIVTMTTASKALEGELPNLEDFTNSAAIIGSIGVIGAGVRYSPMATAKMKNVFAKKGIKPETVLADAEANPVLKQQLLSENPNVESYGIETGRIKIEKELKQEVAAKVEDFPISPNLAKIKDSPEHSPSSMDGEKFRTYFVDKLYPIKKQLAALTSESTANDVYSLFRMLPDSKAKVKHFFEKATMDFNTLENNGEGFFDITKDVEKVDKNLDGFKDYLISRRVLDYERKGLKHGFDLEYSKKFVKENSEKYKQFAERFDAFNDKMLNYLKDSGIYNDDQIARIRESSKDFIPLKRIFSDENASKGGKGKASVKRRTGSERDIQDPFLSLVENAEAYIETAEKNRAQKSFVDAAIKVEDQDLITKEKSVNAPINVTKEVSKILEDYGIDATDEAFTVFRPSNKRLAKNQIEIFRDGKREVYTINDDLLAESFKSLDFAAQSANPIIATMAAFTKVKKIGISFTPEFISRNFFRDQVSAGVFSEAEGLALKDVVVSMGDFLKKNDEYYRWLKAGGANGAFMEFGDRYLKDNIYKSKEMMSARERVINVVKKPVEFIELLGNLTEQATRMAEFKRISKGATFGKQLLKAGMSSREITLDYQKVGLKVQALNQIIAYLNPSIQGLDKTAQSFRNDPKKVALRAGALITVPSLVLAYVNKDDERVKELPQWQKDFFWIIANDDWQDAAPQDQWQGLPDYLVRQEGGKVQINRGSIYRIPKPAELGLVFGSIPERIFNSFAQGKDSTYGLSDAIVSTLTPNLMPDAFAPVLEQMTNKSFFSGSHLIPFYLEKVAPEDQYKEYTSETAIALGKIIGHVPFIGNIGPDSTKLSSPIIVENYIRSWTGTLGSYALQISDEALKAAGQGKTKVYPSKALSDMPVIKAFTVRYPTMSADSIVKFNDKASEMEKIQNSFKLKMKRFQTDQAMYLLQENELSMANLSGFKKSISTINQTINNIYYNDSISSDNKKQLIESSYYQMVEIAKSGLEVTRQLEDNVKKLEQEK